MLLQEFTHNIKLDELVANLSNPEATESNRDKNFHPEIDYSLGYLQPIAQIRNFEFSTKNIKSIEIDCYDKIPKINTSLTFDLLHPFSNVILRDKEIFKTFMRSSNPKKNNIRCDFFITSINTLKKENRSDIYISGELNIPRLHSALDKSYKGSSLKVLKSIANDLGLGFVTNISSTDDDMIWISTNKTYYQFIDYIVKHSWIDDNSFTDWYIDAYYNLVFYEVDSTLKKEEYTTRAYWNKSSSKETHYEKGEVNNSIEWANIFTDLPSMVSTDHGMNPSSFKVINNSGLSKNGYYVNNILIDYSDLEVVKFNCETIYNPKEGIPLKGREDDNTYKEELRVKYLGIQNDNMHPNYMYAVIHNSINNMELRKLNIEFDSSDLNLNYIIGNNIRLEIIEQRLEDSSNKEFYERRRGGKNISDLYFTNNYKIHGIKYIYKNDGQYCKYLVTRREWPEIKEFNI
jgi:hypothetical protein